MLGPSWDGNLLSLAENSGIGTFMMFQGASIGQPRVSPQIVRSPLQGGEGKPTSITVFLKLCDVNLCVCMCVCVCVCVCVLLSRVPLFVTPLTIALQAPLSMGCRF